jgi:hypothetical protein
LHAGNNTLSVTFTPSDTTDYTTATASVVLYVGKATPTITWPKPADIVYGTPLSSIQFNATANVPGTFAYSQSVGDILPVSSDMIMVTFTPTDSADYNSVTTATTINVKTNAQIASWSVSIMNGSTPYYSAGNMSPAWFASNESWLASWLRTCGTPGSGYSMTVNTTVYSSVQSGGSTVNTTTTSTVSVASGVPSYEYYTKGTLIKSSYPEFYTLDIKDTGSTFTSNYVHDISGDYDFTIQESLSQSTPASSFGSPTPLLEQLGASDPYGLYFTDSLYETASQMTTPYYSSWITSNSGNLGLGWSDPNYMIGEICPAFNADADAPPVPTFSIFRINTAGLNPWANYTSTSNGGDWTANTSMSGSGWNYTWYAATTPPTT